MILTRRRLLARLGAVEPRLVRLCAPPGYGKTEFAALWARRYDRHATCSCSAIAGAADFAGRLMSALARESHGSSEGLARTRLFLHVTEADDAAWSRSLLEAWKLRQERALLTLENADAVAAQPSVLALLGDLLAARPAERVLLLSSRRPLPIDAGRYLAPHQVLTLTSAELQLENDDAASIFEGTDLGQSTVDRIVNLAGGWPIALLLLARIAHYEPNLERLLDRLSGTETDLHEYVLNEILSAVTPDMMSTMLAAAAIPRATLEDISVATGIAHAAPVIEGLLRLPGFIIFQAGTYQIHPLIHSALRTRHEGEFAAYVVRAAVGNEGLGDFLRAAELFNAAGDGEAAASALDRLPPATLAQASPRVIDALTKIPVSAIVAHPNLWIATLPYRRHVVDVARLHEEAAALQQAVTPDASQALHRRLGVRRAMLACGRNRLSEAQAALEALGEGGAAGETPEEQRLVLMASAVVAAKRGRFSEADELIEQSDAVHEARHLSFEDERAQIAMEKAAAHGEWDGLLKIAEERLSVALQTGSTERIVDAAQTVARAAWYRDDDDRVGAAAQIVKDSGIAVTGAIEMVAIADLQAALSTSNVERAAALLDRAIDRVDASEDDFLRIVVRVCAALLAPAQRRRLLEARAIAEPIESHPLQTSIELLIDSAEPADHGMFKNLAARVARSPLRARDDRLFVDVLGGRVRRGSDVLRVSDRGLELLAALALFEAGTAHELAAALWPALDRKAAVNALKMCVSRTRAQIGDRESIQNARNGYALGDRVESDVRELQRLLHSVRGAGTLGESLRQQLHQALSTWRDRKPGYAADWKWFGPYAARLAEMRRELELALEWDAARREGARDREAIPR
jgi:ATP/maltotriose-dependent transcriptional regulator MalT